MTDIAINPVARRAQFTGNTGTGPFAFTFNILADADIAVYKNTTLLTLTTDYTISTNANGTGSVTLTGSNNGTALVASDVLTIIGGRNLSRTTDFVTAGDLLASSLNEQLDSIVVMAQQLDEKLTRSVKVNPGDVFTDLELPLKDARKGAVLGFNATSGDPEPGPTIADTQALAAITADIATLADIEDGTDATDAIQTAASNSSNISTVAGISGNVTTVAGIASNVTSVVGNATNINTVAGSISNVNATGSNISSVNTNATNISAIQGASANASTATTKASQAATSATNAASSATSAATAQTAAEAARDSALAAFDSFDDRYLGAKSSAPSVDNDGNALVSGALYYDTTSNAMQVYTGSAWVAAYASLSGALLVTNNLSDLNNAATSATNLGLGTGNTPTFNGVNTTGDISFGDSDKAKFGAGNDLSIFHDGSNSFINNTVTGALSIKSDDINLLSSSSENMATFVEDGAVSLFHNNSKKFETTSSGISVSGNATFADNGKATFGSSNDLEVYHDGNDSYVDDTGSGGLILRGNAAVTIGKHTGETMGYFEADGAAYLYHNNAIKFQTSSVGSQTDQLFGISDADTGIALGANGADIMQFYTGNSERMRVDNSGNVGINTSSTANVKLNIASGTDATGNGDGIAFYGSSANNQASIQSFNAGGYSGDLRFYTASRSSASTSVGGERMRLESDGDLHVDGNVIAYSTTISDERLKEDIKPITGALDKVGQLSGYTFTYKADGKQSAGVIAQEVEAVLPSAVTESTLPLKTDDDVEYKTVQYDQLHGLLIEAIKELKAEIEELKNGASK